jgi:hypothetical protein
MAQKWQALLFYDCEIGACCDSLLEPSLLYITDYVCVSFGAITLCFQSMASFVTEIGALSSARRLALLPRVAFLVYCR